MTVSITRKDPFTLNENEHESDNFYFDVDVTQNELTP